MKLFNGNIIKISTEQTDIRIGDCVSVEKASHTNIRRISSVHCETKNQSDSPPHHQAAASDCQKAKDEPAKAQTDGAVDIAEKKVRVLCED